MDTTMVFDEKNIRRRIYDALNVLMAMDVITRDRKNIRWKGFPVTNEETRETVLSRIDVLEKSIRKKSREIEKKAFHFLGLKNIVKRNTEQGIGETLETDKCKLQIPFVLAQTKDIHDVELEIHSDRKRASLYFSNKFELHDDKSVLDLMEMHKVEDEESLKQAFPNCPEISSLLLKKRPDIVRKPPSSS
uniref:E2F/DP family winged-helix DNA-binding domain-containing protein n=1 Tax=Hanusia phi TaxID=3032 RepID=A0A7S0ELR9_9CRYP